MNITPEQAAVALRQVERTRSRSVEFYGYRIASTQLVLWGIFWMIGYGGTDLVPAQAGYLWGSLGLAWLVLGMVFSRPKAGPNSAGTGFRWRTLAIFAAFSLFIGCTAAIMHPQGSEMGAFVPLLVALTYQVMGLWFGWRYCAIGVAVTILTMVGFFLLHAHFLLWMAVVGGGALILTGIWMRRA